MWHNLPTGGAARALDDQISGLIARGHEIQVWVPPSATPCAADRVLRTNVVPLRRPGRAPALRRLRSAWRGSRPDLEAFDEHSARCAEAIREFDPDVLFAHSCQFFRVPAIGEFVECPSVVYLHEPNRRLAEASAQSPWIAASESRDLRPSSIRRFVSELLEVEGQRILLRFETDRVHAFDDVFVNSAYSREAVLRAYGRHSQISLLGIDHRRFPFQDRPSEVRGAVLAVGALTPEKNAAFLVRAMAAAGPLVRKFTWVANHVDEDYLPVVAKCVADTGVDFDLRHAISDAELIDCFGAADVFVYAPRLEPFGLAPLEANSTGLPVVAVAEGGVRETIVDGVNGVTAPHDEEEFGAAVAVLLRTPLRARSLGRSAHEHVVERWPVEASIARLERQLTAVVRSKGGRNG